MRWRHPHAPRALHRPAVDRADDVRGGLHPHQSGTDDDRRDGDRDPQRPEKGLPAQTLHDPAELQADQYEQATVDHEGGQVPEREGLNPGPGADDARRRVGEHETGDDHRHHPAGVHELGEQEGEERRQYAERALPLRIVEPTADQDDQAAGEQARGDAARIGAHEAARDRERSRRHRADRHLRCHPEQDQRRPVVDQTLRAQRRQRSPGETLRQTGHRRRVRRREHRAQHPRRSRVHAQRPPRVGHRRHRHDHQHHARQHDHPQVRADLPQTGVQALPIQDCR
jgi:hypothetical protein